MKTAAGMMVKDEVDVIHWTIRHLGQQGIERVYVLDNGSRDGTRQSLVKIRFRPEVLVVDDPEVGYYQSEKMTALLREAHADGFDWFVPCDADELWYAVEGGTVADALAKAPESVGAVEAVLFDYYVTGFDRPFLNPFERITYRRATPGALPKVAVRCAPDVVIEQGNHGAKATPPLHTMNGLMIRHYPYRSVDHFISKAINGAAAYRATDLPEKMGYHWRIYGDLYDKWGREGMEAWFHEHFFHADPEAAGLVYDPAVRG